MLNPWSKTLLSFINRCCCPRQTLFIWRWESFLALAFPMELTSIDQSSLLCCYCREFRSLRCACISLVTHFKAPTAFCHRTWVWQSRRTKLASYWAIPWRNPNPVRAVLLKGKNRKPAVLYRSEPCSTLRSFEDLIHYKAIRPWHAALRRGQAACSARAIEIKESVRKWFMYFKHS